MIHRMDPPADPDREPMPAHLVPMLAKLGSAARERGRLRLRGQVGRDPRALLLRAGPLPHREPQPQRHHRAVPRAAAARPPARLARRDPRRRDRRARRPRPAELRASPAAHAPDARRRHQAAREGGPGSVPPVRPALPRGALDHGAALRGAPRAARVARPRGPRLAGAAPITAAKGSALLEASAKQGLEGVVAKRLDSAYSPGRRSPAWIKVKNKQRARARDRRAGCRRRSAPTAWAPCWSATSTREGQLPLRRPRRHGLGRARSARAWRSCSPRSRASARRSRASAGRAARNTSSRASSPRSSSRSGPTTGCCATPPTRASSTTSRSRSCSTSHATTAPMPSSSGRGQCRAERDPRAGRSSSVARRSR